MLRFFGIDTIRSVVIHLGTTSPFLSVVAVGCPRTDLLFTDFLFKGFQSHTYPVLNIQSTRKNN